MPSFKKLSALVLFLGLFACVANAAPAKSATTSAKKETPAPAKTVANSKNGAGAGAGAVKCKPRAVAGGAKKQATLKTRTNVVHPSAKGKITLYHASKAPMTGINLAKSKQLGDFHRGKGAFYLTDSWWHAVQYICKAHSSSGDMINVYEYKWDGTSANVHEFKDNGEEWKGYSKWITTQKADKPADEATYKKILASDMITGPMKAAADAFLRIAPDFWQYALVSPNAVSKLVKDHEFQVKCKSLLSADYEPSQHYQTVRPTDEELGQLNNC